MDNLSVAKRFVGAQVLKQGLGYIRRDPERNLGRLLDLAEKVAPLPGQKDDVRRVRTAIRENEAVRQFVHRLFTELSPNVQQRLLVNYFFNSLLFGVPQQRRLAAQVGMQIPHLILIDPTSACNLACTGCWAGKYSKADTLPPELVDRVIREAKEMGIYFIAMSGGEPTAYKHFFDVVERHRDVVFMFYTNGTLIDETFADRLAELGNVSPAISLEGFEEATDERRGQGTWNRVMRAMDLLHERGVAFGVSLTVTRQNAETLFSDEFLHFLIGKGVLYGWSFHYIPVGKDVDLDRMITPEQRGYLTRRVREVRRTLPLQIADFWNDGDLTGGCIAGGRRYLHINAKGEVEPCAFVHFAVDNIKEKSLREAITSPFFRAYQERQPMYENMLRPCPIIDRPQALREIVAEAGAHPTHAGVAELLTGEAARTLDERAEQWGKVADGLWEERLRERQARTPGAHPDVPADLIQAVWAERDRQQMGAD